MLAIFFFFFSPIYNLNLVKKYRFYAFLNKQFDVRIETKFSIVLSKKKKKTTNDLIKESRKESRR